MQLTSLTYYKKWIGGNKSWKESPCPNGPPCAVELSGATAEENTNKPNICAAPQGNVAAAAKNVRNPLPPGRWYPKSRPIEHYRRSYNGGNNITINSIEIPGGATFRRIGICGDGNICGFPITSHYLTKINKTDTCTFKDPTTGYTTCFAKNAQTRVQNGTTMTASNFNTTTVYNITNSGYLYSRGKTYDQLAVPIQTKKTNTTSNTFDYPTPYFYNIKCPNGKFLNTRIPTHFKPSNHQFNTNNAVTSGTRVSKLKFDTILSDAYMNNEIMSPNFSSTLTAGQEINHVFLTDEKPVQCFLNRANRVSGRYRFNCDNYKVKDTLTPREQAVAQERDVAKAVAAVGTPANIAINLDSFYTKSEHVQKQPDDHQLESDTKHTELETEKNKNSEETKKVHTDFNEKTINPSLEKALYELVDNFHQFEQIQHDFTRDLTYDIEELTALGQHVINSAMIYDIDHLYVYKNIIETHIARARNAQERINKNTLIFNEQYIAKQLEHLIALQTEFANLILDATIHLPFDDPNSAVKALLVTNMFNDLSLANTFKINLEHFISQLKLKTLIKLSTHIRSFLEPEGIINNFFSNASRAVGMVVNFPFKNTMPSTHWMFFKHYRRDGILSNNMHVGYIDGITGASGTRDLNILAADAQGNITTKSFKTSINWEANGMIHMRAFTPAEIVDDINIFPIQFSFLAVATRTGTTEDIKLQDWSFSIGGENRWLSSETIDQYIHVIPPNGLHAVMTEYNDKVEVMLIDVAGTHKHYRLSASSDTGQAHEITVDGDQSTATSLI